MLTNLAWLSPGEKFPPDSEKERMDMYTANKKLFESKHAEVYVEQLKRIERVIGNFGDVVSYPVLVNFQKLMSLKIADLLLGETPDITTSKKKTQDNQDSSIISDDTDTKAQAAIDEIIKNSDLMNIAFQAAIDVSRYGDGLLYVRKDAAGKGIIDITQPPLWFPIVNPDNVHEILYHVIAWIIGSGDNQQIKARINAKGYYEERIFAYDNGTLGKLLSTTGNIATGLDDNAIIQIPNVLTSDRTTGIDDYTDIDSIISDIIVRLGQIDRILDKHADPSMEGSVNALEQDPLTGEWRFKAGNFIQREEGDPETKYITWDGQLDANFKQIEKLINFLYTISEMGSAVFGDLSTNTGQVASGSALKRLMISPLAKVNRIRMRMDPALKKAIKLCSQLGGKNVINLSDIDINIKWNDGLPSDPVEEANIINTRTAGKATMSQFRALQVYDGMNDQDAEEELARINEEESSSSPMATPPFSDNTPSDNPLDSQTQDNNQDDFINQG